MRVESQRNHPRVEYPADVRLSSPVLDEPLRGRALNLSPTGIFIETTATCAVGTALVCDLPLPGGRRRLKGRVARTQPLPRASVGLGIEFLDLDARDAAALRDVIGPVGADRYRLVKVQFEGMREPLRSQAEIVGDDVRISTALPFLRLSSTADVSFIAGDSRVESRGVVRAVRIEPQGADGVPRLSVDVTMDRPQAEDRPQGEDKPRAEDRPRANAGAAPDEPRPSPRIVAAPVAPARPAGAPTPATKRPHAAPRRRVHVRRVRAAAPGALPRTELSPAAVTTRELLLGPGDTTPVPVANERPRPSDARVSRIFFVAVPAVLVVMAAALVSTHLRVTSMQVAAVQTPAATPTRAAALQVPTPTPTRAAAVPPMAPASTPVVAEAAAPPAAPITLLALPPLDMVPRPKPRPAFRASGPVPEGAPGPTVEVDGPRVTVTVPVTGPTDGMTQHSMARPDGLVVNLPHARAALAPGVHTLGRDGFRSVWVRERVAGGVQLRFHFGTPTPDARVLDVDGEAVKVRVKLR